MSITIATSLDLKGLSCPLPIIKTAKAMKELAPGQLLEAFATDPVRSRISRLGRKPRAIHSWSQARTAGFTTLS